MKSLLLAMSIAGVMLAESKGGATHPKLSYYFEPTYTDVLRVEPSGTPGIVEVAQGKLHFGVKSGMKFLSQSGAELAIPYESIKGFTYERGRSFKTAHKPSKFNPSWSPFKPGVRSKHVLTVHYDANGEEKDMTMRLESHNYQNIIGTLEAKTGKTVERPGVGTRNW